MVPVTRLRIEIGSFAYPDGTVAMQDIRFDVMNGEFAGILGANGSGKTTLLRIMDGMLKDFKGSVHLDGSNIRKLTPREIYRKVGLVFQNPDDQLFADTVAEDVAFGPINMGFSPRGVDERVRKALTDVDMEKYYRKSIHTLSFGQKKRVCIAGLLAEPTAGLDPMGEYRMMKLLTQLNKADGVTIVMATHSVDLVPLFLDRLYILSGGRVTRSGLPEEVFTAPHDMARVKLRLPHIADMIYKLKHEDGVPFGKIPLTVGEARREVLRLFEAGGAKREINE
jgi:cobalt/nickel transport system ATP-binding protein